MRSLNLRGCARIGKPGGRIKVIGRILRDNLVVPRKTPRCVSRMILVSDGVSLRVHLAHDSRLNSGLGPMKLCRAERVPVHYFSSVWTDEPNILAM